MTLIEKGSGRVAIRLQRGDIKSGVPLDEQQHLIQDVGRAISIRAAGIIGPDAAQIELLNNGYTSAYEGAAISFQEVTAKDRRTKIIEGYNSELQFRATIQSATGEGVQITSQTAVSCKRYSAMVNVDTDGNTTVRIVGIRDKGMGTFEIIDVESNNHQQLTIALKELGISL